MNPLLKLMPAPTHDWLKSRVADALVAAGADPTSIRYDPEDLQLRVGDQHIFLGNLLALCRTLWPWQRRAAIRQFLGMFTQPPDRPRTFDEARPHLLPGIRDSYLFDGLAIRSRIEGQAPLGPSGHALGQRLWMALYVDFPKSTSVVSSKDLEDWGVSMEDALPVALENLGRRSEAPMSAVGPGVYHSPWHDCYDPARILRRETFSTLDLDGEPVVLAPNWNHLVVTGSHDHAGLSAAISFALKVLEEEPRPMSALPMVRRGGEWVELDLPVGHPVEPVLRKARVLEMSGIYRDQGPLLEKLLEKEARHVFVAAYNGLRDKEDGYDSYAVWSRGVPTLLPRTERVVFFDDARPRENKVVADVRWPLVQLHCRDLMKDTGHSPQRLYVEDFPTQTQLEAMRADPAR